MKSLPIYKMAALYDAEQAIIKHPITEHMVKRIYELEYKIFAIESFNSSKVSAQKAIEKFSAELAPLLGRAILAMKEVYNWWIKFHADIVVDPEAIRAKIIKEYPELSVKRIDDELVNMALGKITPHYDAFRKIEVQAIKEAWAVPPFSNILDMAKVLRNGPSGNIDKDSVLFQRALTTVHHGGPMLNHFAEQTGISEQLLNDLSSDKFIASWDAEIARFASITYIWKKLAEIKKDEKDIEQYAINYPYEFFMEGFADNPEFKKFALTAANALANKDPLKVLELRLHKYTELDPATRKALDHASNLAKKNNPAAIKIIMRFLKEGPGYKNTERLWNNIPVRAILKDNPRFIYNLEENGLLEERSVAGRYKNIITDSLKALLSEQSSPEWFWRLGIINIFPSIGRSPFYIKKALPALRPEFLAQINIDSLPIESKTILSEYKQNILNAQKQEDLKSEEDVVKNPSGGAPLVKKLFQTEGRPHWAKETAALLAQNNIDVFVHVRPIYKTSDIQKEVNRVSNVKNVVGEISVSTIDKSPKLFIQKDRFAPPVVVGTLLSGRVSHYFAQDSNSKVDEQLGVRRLRSLKDPKSKEPYLLKQPDKNLADEGWFNPSETNNKIITMFVISRKPSPITIEEEAKFETLREMVIKSAEIASHKHNVPMVNFSCDSDNEMISILKNLGETTHREKEENIDKQISQREMREEQMEEELIRRKSMVIRPLSKRASRIDYPKKMHAEIFDWAKNIVLAKAKKIAEDKKRLAFAHVKLHPFDKSPTREDSPKAIDWADDLVDSLTSRDRNGNFDPKVPSIIMDLAARNKLDISKFHKEEGYNGPEYYASNWNGDVRIRKATSDIVSGELVYSIPTVDITGRGNDDIGDIPAGEITFDFNMDYANNRFTIDTIDERWIEEQRQKIQLLVEKLNEEELTKFYNTDDGELPSLHLGNPRLVSVSIPDDDSFRFFSGPLYSYQKLLADALHTTFNLEEFYSRISAIRDLYNQPSKVAENDFISSASANYKEFPIDVSDTYQGQRTNDAFNVMVRSLQDHNQIPRTVKVEIIHDLNEDAAGTWSSSQFKIRIYNTSVELGNGAYISSALERLDNTLKHELVHMMQTIMTIRTINKKIEFSQKKFCPKCGFEASVFEHYYCPKCGTQLVDRETGGPANFDPTKHMRYYDKKPGTTKDEYHKQHATSDIEFYTRLQDAVEDMKEMAKKQYLEFHEADKIMRAFPKDSPDFNKESRSTSALTPEQFKFLLNDRFKVFIKYNSTLNALLQSGERERADKFIRELYREYLKAAPYPARISRRSPKEDHADDENKNPFADWLEEYKTNPVIKEEKFKKTKQVELWHGVRNQDALQKLPNGKYLLTPKPGSDLQKLWFVPAWTSRDKEVALGYASHALVKIKIEFEFEYEKDTKKDGSVSEFIISYKPITPKWERSYQVQEWYLHDGALEIDPSQIMFTEQIEEMLVSLQGSYRPLSIRIATQEMMAFWISPTGDVHTVDDPMGHRGFIMHHPEFFGHDPDGEYPYELAFSKGWIRVAAFSNFMTFDVPGKLSEHGLSRIQNALEKLPRAVNIRISDDNKIYDTTYIALCFSNSVSDLKKNLAARRVGLSKRAKEHDSAGVFIVLPKELAKQFPSLGEHDDSNPHVTVLYVGDVPKNKKDLFVETATNILEEQKPFELKLDDKVTYFEPTKHSDNCKIAKISVVSKELHTLHNKLKKALKEAGIQIDDHFPDYKPHVTLEYMEPPKEKFDGDVPSGSWTANSAEIWGSGNKKRIRLNKKSRISKRASSVYGWWLSPSAELFPVEMYEHAAFVARHQDIFGPLKNGESAYNIAFDHGWTRIVGVEHDYLAVEVPSFDGKNLSRVQHILPALMPRKEIEISAPGEPVIGPISVADFLSASNFRDLKRIAKLASKTLVVKHADNKDMAELRDELFEQLARAQRGKPESAMLKIQHSQIAQLYGYVCEHVGDLTHRMSEKPSFFEGQYGAVKEKVNKTLYALTNQYGFKKEVLEQIKNNLELHQKEDGTMLDETFESRLNKLKELGKQYAAAHQALTVYNDAQEHARSAAVAMGEWRFESAINRLLELKHHLDKGADHWAEYALEFNMPTKISIRDVEQDAKDPLSTYKKKREFDETPEPEGKIEKGNKHRFVIQRHKAKKAGEHFDFRLENDDGAMSSWAIPKARLPHGKEKLLAQKTEDHPISYNKFHGEIPEGEYGAGTVEIYDSGTYEEIEWSADKIKLKLNGKKEKGRYTMIKTDGKRWLIMPGKED